MVSMNERWLQLNKCMKKGEMFNNGQIFFEAIL